MISVKKGFIQGVIEANYQIKFLNHQVTYKSTAFFDVSVYGMQVCTQIFCLLHDKFLNLPLKRI